MTVVRRRFHTSLTYHRLRRECYPAKHYMPLQALLGLAIHVHSPLHPCPTTAKRRSKAIIRRLGPQLQVPNVLGIISIAMDP